MDWLVDHLAVVMFFGLIFIMFLGYPVAFLLGAMGIGFGLLGVLTDVFNVAQFANLLPRDTANTAVWLQRVSHAFETAGPDYALWMARHHCELYP